MPSMCVNGCKSALSGQKARKGARKVSNKMLESEDWLLLSITVCLDFSMVKN